MFQGLFDIFDSLRVALDWERDLQRRSLHDD